MSDFENQKTEIREFTFFGKTMEKISIMYGVFLILWGISVSFLSNSSSFTSFIPSFFGFPILLFAVLALKFPHKKKLFMHLVVLIGLIVFIGGLDFSRGILKGNLFDNMWADISKLMMLITGLMFTFLCIKSFVFARKNKE